ncbi:MAG: prolyl oligopeptidase family serine peptidase [Acidobacteria bacterium]|nr:prolyl oligopeptidase family serine peptidase [Acidobacteriota bacterium]
MPRASPYGTWASPLSATEVAAGQLQLGAVALDGDDIYWLEGRPREGGRYGLMRRTPDGRTAEVTPPDINVRSRVHEYGGAAYVVSRGVVYCSNFADQRVYRVGGSTKQDPALARPEPITPAGAWFYADFEIDARRQRLICVREDHTHEEREPINTLVTIPLAGALSAGEVFASGADFYSTPRLSPDGCKLAWLSWRHPLMPWDGTALWVAQVGASGALEEPVHVAGGPDESIYQPGWSADGTLYFVSDRDGWWRLYRAGRARSAGPKPLYTIETVLRKPLAEAEFGRPQWVLGTSTWAFADPSRLVASYTRAGMWHLATIDAQSGTLIDIATHLQPHDWIAASATHTVFVAGSATTPDAVSRFEFASGAVETLRAGSSVRLDTGYISVAEAIEFPTAAGRTAHAFYYPPRNKDFAAPAGERPPLMVISHGGPTSAARPTLDLQIQYWTSRGFAVADINYGGSSGYGRAYRRRLNGQWGIVDVADVIHAARFLAAQGMADGERAVIRGGSAGGYTTLAALTFHPEVFKAGASYYGVSDLEALELDTHKFESRYSHSLVGPYPAAKDIYRARSPIHAIDRLACPLILFQGLEDKVVPPNQSQMMADAVRAKGLPVAYLAFEGEQHGFRKAETIIRSLEAELYFYGAVFGFKPADPIAPVRIGNL